MVLLTPTSQDTLLYVSCMLTSQSVHCWCLYLWGGVGALPPTKIITRSETLALCLISRWLSFFTRERIKVPCSGFLQLFAHCRGWELRVKTKALFNLVSRKDKTLCFPWLQVSTPLKASLHWLTATLTRGHVGIGFFGGGSLQWSFKVIFCFIF